MKTANKWMCWGASLLALAFLSGPVAAAQTRSKTITSSSQDDDGPRVEKRISITLDGGEGSSWLGVETQEVTPDTVEKLQLKAERGVVIGKVIPDSPAAKAGLEEDDVITAVNGQTLEGTVQFRRMIQEIPAGRSVELSVWRDGHSQTLSATLGKSEQNRRPMWFQSEPSNAFVFKTPELRDMPEIRELPEMNFDGGTLMGMRPRLGIEAEDLSGDLGRYFGAPEGEGVLVREVKPSSPADKAGLKAGDVITSVNGQRVRTVGDLREQLASKDSATSAKLGILRNKSEMSLSVDLPAQALPRVPHLVSLRTNI